MTSESSIPERIIAVKTHALGDVLMVTPAIRALRQSFPDSQIDFLTGSWSADAIRDNPHINTVIEVADEDFHHVRTPALAALSRRIRGNRYDLGILFQPSLAVRLLMSISGIKELAGPVSGKFSFGLTYHSRWRGDRDRYVVEDFLDVVRSVGIKSIDTSLNFHIPKEESDKFLQKLSEYNLSPGNYLVICPGGGRNPRDFVKQKIWPSERFRELVIALQKESIRVVIAGSLTDREFLEPVIGLPGIVDWTGRTTFVQLGACLRAAGLLLTNDSAPMHLALAVGCPFVAIFGPSRQNALLPVSGKFNVIHADIPCAPCYDNELFGRCGRLDCINSIGVETVLDSVLVAWEKWSKQEYNHD